jgi:hypothetical protein
MVSAYVAQATSILAHHRLRPSAAAGSQAANAGCTHGSDYELNHLVVDLTDMTGVVARLHR